MGLFNRKRLVLLFVIVYSFVYGQDYFANTRKIGIEDGLSHYRVSSFYPEVNGMWIGAKNGLNFYDGYNWKYWTREDGQLNIETINYIYKDPEDLLWLFEAESIDRKKEIQNIDILNSARDSVLSFEQYFGDQAPFELKTVQRFFEDKQKRIYFFANDQLWRYSSSDRFQLILLPSGFEPYTIFSDGTYVGRLSGKLAVVSKEGNLVYTPNQDLNELDISIMGTNQKFWVSDLHAPILIFEKGANEIYQIKKYPLLTKENHYTQLLYFDEQQNQVWVRKGSNTYILDTQEQLLHQHKISPKWIVKDHNDNIWMTKSEIEILQLKQTKFSRYLYSFSKGNNSYRCRGFVEKDGKLYVNTYLGTRVIDLATKETNNPFKKNRRVFVALKTKENKITLANRNVYQLDESDAPTIIFEDESKILERTWSLFEDRNGKVWNGNLGLSYYENDKVIDFEKYNEFKELEKAVVLFFYKDKNGVVWVGGERGLYQLDLEKGIIAAYGKSRKGAFHLPSSKFQHMHQDAQGVFWIATEDAGLIRWNKANGNIQCFGKKEGMLSNNIYGVYEDDFGYLWMSSFNGLIRFHKESKNIKIYTEEDGITHNEFNRISHYQSEDGHIYFGGQNGITGFHPKDIHTGQTEEEDFKLAINHVSIFGSNIFKDTLPDGSAIDLMNLNPGARVIDFEIGASDLFWTDKTNLHYTLQAIGDYEKALPSFKEKISSDNHVELFGLHPGRYILQVKAVHKNGKRLGEPLNIEIYISKPFFQKPIFWVFVVFAIGVVTWGYIKIKTARLRKRQVELETLVTERTNQILKDQKVIQTQAEEIEVMKDQLNQKDERWMEQFQEIINERLEDPDLYLPDIIESMDISRSAFYEKVKTLTQMTPNQYIQEIRLTKAKVILDEGNVKTVKEVALAIGMKRPSYFSKLYKERFGIMPSAYLRERLN